MKTAPVPFAHPSHAAFAWEGGVEEGGVGVSDLSSKAHTCCLRVVCFLLFTFIYYVIYP